MKSIKQQYIDLREGNMTQANFMRNLRMSLPQYVTNITSFDDSVRILKNKGILTEADIKENMQEELWMAAFDTAIDRDMNLSPEDKELVSRALDHVNPFMNYGDMNPAEAAAEFIEDVLYSQEANDDYDADYEEPNEPFDIAEMLDPTAAEEIAKLAGSYEAAVDKLMDMGLTSQEADKIANELYPEEEEYNDDDYYNDLRADDYRMNQLDEAKDPSSEGKWKTVTGKDLYAQFKEIDNLNAQEVLIGIDYEMQKNPELTKVAAAKIVVKNLKKNPIYYTSSLMSGIEGYEPEYIGGKSANPEARQMQYLDKNMGNVVDKKRGMQPVKDVEKAKKDSDKGGETNKTVKGVELMSLIAKTVRGMKKMDATGEKMKKIIMKEGMEGQYTFNGYFKGGELDKLMTMIPDAEIDDQVEYGQGTKTTIFSQQYSDEEIRKAVNSVIGMPGTKKDVPGTIFNKNAGISSGLKSLTKEDLMEMIRKEIAGAYGGDQMSAEDGDSYINEIKLFADFRDSIIPKRSIESRFARSISEIAREYDYLDNINITPILNDNGEEIVSGLFDEYEEGDDFYAGPVESLEFFKALPNEFIVINNMNDVDESFKITKTGDNTFTAEEI